MLQREVQKRTGLKWKTSSEHSGRKPAIVLATVTERELAGLAVPRRDGRDLPRATRGIPDLRDTQRRRRAGVWVIGADARGVLFGTGRLLRLLNWGRDGVSLAEATDISTSPATPFAAINWATVLAPTPTMPGVYLAYEAVCPRSDPVWLQLHENIPFQDDQPSPHMTVRGRDECGSQPGFATPMT